MKFRVYRIYANLLRQNLIFDHQARCQNGFFALTAQWLPRIETTARTPSTKYDSKLTSRNFII